MKICMLSSVHSANDIRIFEKEARSLSESGHAVTVVARPPCPGERGRIDFKPIELPAVARWKRPWVMGVAATTLARATEADVVQIHDPELIPFALWLKRGGCKVIYDVHEDVPADIYSKKWIPRWMQPIVAAGMELVERSTARRFDAIVAATPAIAKRFRDFGAAVTLVRNSVRLEEFIEPTSSTSRKRQAVYIGHASFNRGLVEMVEACQAARLPLVLAGSIGATESEWLTRSSAEFVHRGKLGRTEIAALLNESLIGLCLFQPEPNHLYAMPTKIFEYMAAGVPVITSDLPRSKEIVEAAGCGFSVSLEDKRRLAERLSSLADAPKRAIELGLAGRAAVAKEYNWQHDAAELNKLYQELSPLGAVA
ncbi:glycosyltransferase [Bradyrhizobium sp. BWA-3-5]|uniref:glycosyltransferase n=1 Tax=Bradyrhizobium sp. BWA-3-5 TaxID=3080013 RepID=UPI00293ECD42|nr:glycosyltransferase [Bradyrhizobium sp. BWA-3-5]WOH68174.1 glycosyltransferase [Bradyrhizobium sp. BWA-3-5]